MSADMKILRDEHTEVLHQLFAMDKNNAALFRENMELRRLVTDESGPLHRQATEPKFNFRSDQVSQMNKSIPLT